MNTLLAPSIALVKTDRTISMHELGDLVNELSNRFFYHDEWENDIWDFFYELPQENELNINVILDELERQKKLFLNGNEWIYRLYNYLEELLVNGNAVLNLD